VTEVESAEAERFDSWVDAGFVDPKRRRAARSPKKRSDFGNYIVVGDDRMDVFVYFDGKLDLDLDEIEDSLEKALSGIGEVIGSGLGEAGCNIDIKVNDAKVRPAVLIELIREAVQPLKLGGSGKIVVDGREYPLAEPV
jgi:hypothetical protein